jgi:hypothetical protein
MSRRAPAPAAAPADTDTTADARLWRSIPAMADVLNEGSKHPTFTTHALRHLTRAAAENGLAPHVRRIGRKILVDERGFRRWLNEQRG